MLKTLRDAFKIKALRQKILFTFAMLVVVRIGSQLPVPGINGDFFQSWFKSTTDGAFNFFDAITGGFNLQAAWTTGYVAGLHMACP